ncbi:hypothetical protein AB0G48_18345 [Streptomyces rubiginosohelvolus]
MESIDSARRLEPASGTTRQADRHQVPSGRKLFLTEGVVSLDRAP